MKTIIKLILCAMFFVVPTHAQSVQRQGNTFTVVKEKGTANKEAKKSKYTIKVDGKTYALYVGPRGGVYYMKDGKKMYNVPKEVKEAVKGA